MIHFANVKKSKRLRRILKALRGGPKTTLQLAMQTGGLAIGTSVSEIRNQGYNIRCDYRNTTKNGSKVYLYRLAKLESNRKDG